MIEFQEKLTKFQQETKARQEAILNNVKFEDKEKTAKEKKEKDGSKRKSTRKSRRSKDTAGSVGDVVEDSLALAVIDEHKEHAGDEKKSPSKRRSTRSRDRDRAGSMGSEGSSEEDHSMEDVSEKSTSSLIASEKATPVKNRQTLIGLLVVNTPDTQVYYK